MQFVDVFVANPNFHSREALTYHCELSTQFSLGQIVTVPLRSGSCLGVISKKRAKVSFKTKPIQEIHPYVLPAHSLELLTTMLRLYPATIGTITQLFVPNFLSQKSRAIPDTSLSSDWQQVQLPPLTKEQITTLDTFTKAPIDQPYILHGKTGSGKTRVFIECARQALDSGKSAIILSPEIGLSSQLSQNFIDIFGERVVTAHSQLTIRQRREIWRRVSAATEPLIIIGPRSSLFLPAQQIGFIGIDEFHEATYKQEQAPYYHAVPVASILAKAAGCKILLSSATPPVNTYFTISQSPTSILKMSQVAVSSSTKNELRVVDMREPNAHSQSQILSDIAVQSIRKRLQNQEQILLFLNRRGTATVVYCKQCGWQSLCAVCENPLTYHGDSHRLVCHLCNSHEQLPNHCPQCQNIDILFRGAGTKAVTSEIERLFPGTQSIRFDADNSKEDSLFKKYQAVKAGGYQIIIGTQMIAKGLDLPLLSCAIIVSADSGLSVPDFTSEERTYQLIHQVIGRVQRGHKDSLTIIQTFQPDNPIIKAAAAQDWQAFYDLEISNRKQFSLPPFKYMAKISFSRKSAAGAQKLGDKLKAQLQAMSGIEALGPAPKFHEKQGGIFNWQIVIKASSRSTILKACLEVPSECRIDIDPVSLL